MSVDTAVSRPRAKKPAAAASKKPASAAPNKAASAAANKAASAAANKATSGPDIDFAALGSTHGLAAALTSAAAELCAATEDGRVCPPLDRNLRLWVAIKTMMGADSAVVPDFVRGNLLQLADRVTAFTAAVGRDFSPERVTQVAEINLKIAQGLIESTLSQLIRDRAYYIWLESGCPEGRDQEHWGAAEQEIKGLMNP